MSNRSNLYNWSLPRSFAAVVTVLTMATTLAADDPSGLWKWTIPARGNQPERVVNLRLKKESGESLTGTVLIPNRTNDTFTSLEIKNAAFRQGALSFETVRVGRSGTNQFVTKYAGTVHGDKIEGKQESLNTAGEKQVIDWRAERNSTGQLVSGPKITVKPGYNEQGYKIVNETKYKDISVEEAAKYIAEHPDAIILDLRPPSAFAAGHLPNARSLDVTDDEHYQDVLKPLDKTKRYVVHSVTGHYRTVRALEYFEAHGFENVVAIEGGYQAWAAAGKPVVK